MERKRFLPPSFRVPFVEEAAFFTRKLRETEIESLQQSMFIRIRIKDARDLAITHGMVPTEVWIGPEEIKIYGDVPYIMGLKVRRSTEPGVWVGQTYGCHE